MSESQRCQPTLGVEDVPEDQLGTSRREFIRKIARLGAGVGAAHFLSLGGKQAWAADDDCDPPYTPAAGDVCNEGAANYDACADLYPQGDECKSDTGSESDYCPGPTYSGSEDYCGAYSGDPDECSPYNSTTGDECTPDDSADDECQSDGNTGDKCGGDYGPGSGGGDECPGGTAASGDTCSPDDKAPGDNCINNQSTGDECDGLGTGDPSPEAGDECTVANSPNSGDECGDESGGSPEASDECSDTTNLDDECEDGVTGDKCILNPTDAGGDYCLHNDYGDQCHASGANASDECDWGIDQSDSCPPPYTADVDVCILGRPIDGDDHCGEDKETGDLCLSLVSGSDEQ